MSQCCTRNQRIALDLFALLSFILLLSSCSYNTLERLALERADTSEDISISEQSGDQTKSDVLAFEYIIKGGRQAFLGVTGQFSRLLVGSEDEIRLKRPVAVGGVDNYLYIADAEDRIVYIYDIVQKEITPLGNVSAKFRGEPGNIYVAQDYSFYVCDELGKQVLHFSQDGILLTTFADAKNLSRPIDIFFDETRQELYVADGSYSHIVVFDSLGKALRLIGERGNTPGKFRAITSITRGPDGIYVLDRLELPVQVLNMMGQFQYGFGEIEQIFPTSIAVSQDKLVFVSDRSDNAIRIYKDKVLIDKVGAGGSAPGRFRIITSLWVNGDLLYVADSENRRVQVFRIKPQNSGLIGLPSDT